MGGRWTATIERAREAAGGAMEKVAGWGLTGAMDGSPVDHACVRCEMQTKP